MTRATFAGGQKFAVTWTGDNNSTWDHLKLAVQQMLNLGLSGFPGLARISAGFIGGASPELRLAGTEIGAFTPMFRSHAANDAPRGEPWVDGPEHLEIRRRYIEERYRLMPYFYAVAEQNSRTGDPIMRPVFYDYPELVEGAVRPVDGLHRRPRSAGRAVAEAGIDAPYDACMPGPGWFDYWSGLPVAGETQARRAVRGGQGNAHARPPARVRPRRRDHASRQPLTQSTSETPERSARAARLSGAGLQRPALLGRRPQYPRPDPSPDRPLHARQGRHHASLRQARRQLQAVVEADRRDRPRLERPRQGARRRECRDRCGDADAVRFVDPRPARAADFVLSAAL